MADEELPDAPWLTPHAGGDDLPDAPWATPTPAAAKPAEEASGTPMARAFEAYRNWMPFSARNMRTAVHNIAEGAREGFGDQPIGKPLTAEEAPLAPEWQEWGEKNKQYYEDMLKLRAFVGMPAEVVGRGVQAGIGAVRGLAGRDVAGMAEMELMGLGHRGMGATGAAYSRAAPGSPGAPLTGEILPPERPPGGPGGPGLPPRTPPTIDLQAEPRPNLDPNVRLIPPDVQHSYRSPPGSAGAARTSTVLDSLSPETRDVLQERFDAQGFTPHTIEQRIDEMSPHEYFGELTPDFEGHTHGIHSTPGQARNEISQSVRQRHAEAPERITAEVNDAFGDPRDVEAWKADVKRRRSQESNPYWQAFDALKITPTPELEALLPALGPQGTGSLGRANKALQIERIPSTDGFPEGAAPEDQERRPTARAYQAAKEDLDDQISTAKRSGSDNEARRLTGLKNALVDAIDNHPDPAIAGVWRIARDTWGGPTGVLKAQDFGRQALTGKYAPDQFADMWEGMSEENRDAAMIGARYYLDRIEGKRGNRDLRANRMLTELSSPDNQQILRIMLGDDRAEQLFEAVEHERRMRNAPTRLMGGSPTADKLAYQRQWQPPESGGPFEAGRKFLGFIRNPLKGSADIAEAHLKEQEARRWENIREEMGRVMTLQGPDRDALYRALADRAAARAGNTPSPPGAAPGAPPAGGPTAPPRPLTPAPGTPPQPAAGPSAPPAPPPPPHSPAMQARVEQLVREGATPLQAGERAVMEIRNAGPAEGLAPLHPSRVLDVTAGAPGGGAQAGAVEGRTGAIPGGTPQAPGAPHPAGNQRGEGAGAAKAPVEERIARLLGTRAKPETMAQTRELLAPRYEARNEARRRREEASRQERDVGREVLSKFELEQVPGRPMTPQEQQAVSGVLGGLPAETLDRMRRAGRELSPEQEAAVVKLLQKQTRQPLTRKGERTRSGRAAGQPFKMLDELNQRILEEGARRVESAGAPQSAKEILEKHEQGMVNAYNEDIPSIKDQYYQFAGEPWSYQELTIKDAADQYGGVDEIPPELKDVIDKHGRAVEITHQHHGSEVYAPHEAPSRDEHMRMAVEEANGLLPAHDIDDIERGITTQTGGVRGAAAEAFAYLAKQMGWKLVGQKYPSAYMTIRHPNAEDSLHVRVSDHPNLTKSNPNAQTPDINLAPGAHDFEDAVRIMQEAVGQRRTLPLKRTERAKGGRVAPPLITRKESHYSPTRGRPDHHCGPDKQWPHGFCAKFRLHNKCTEVGGFIATKGGCDWYRRSDAAEVRREERAAGGRLHRQDGGDIPGWLANQPESAGVESWRATPNERETYESPIGPRTYSSATGPASVSAHEPSWRDVLASALLPDTASYHAREIARNVLGSSGLGREQTSAADFVPGVGAVLNAQEAYQEGDIPGAAGQIAAAAVPAGALASRALIPAARPLVRAGTAALAGFGAGTAATVALTPSEAEAENKRLIDTLTPAEYQDYRRRDAAGREQFLRDKVKAEREEAAGKAQADREERAKQADAIRQEAAKQGDLVRTQAAAKVAQDLALQGERERKEAEIAEAARVARLPFRERYPIAAGTIQAGSMAGAGVLPYFLGKSANRAANVASQEMRDLADRAEQAIRNRNLTSARIAINDMEERLSGGPPRTAWQKTKSGLAGIAGANAALLPFEGGSVIPNAWDYYTHPEGDPVHERAAHEFSTSRLPQNLGIGLAEGVTPSVISREVANIRLPREPFNPARGRGLIKSYEQTFPEDARLGKTAAPAAAPAPEPVPAAPVATAPVGPLTPVEQLPGYIPGLRGRARMLHEGRLRREQAEIEAASRLIGLGNQDRQTRADGGRTFEDRYPGFRERAEWTGATPDEIEDRRGERARYVPTTDRSTYKSNLSDRPSGRLAEDAGYYDADKFAPRATGGRVPTEAQKSLSVMDSNRVKSGSYRKSGISESASDSRITDAKLFGDSANAHAIRVHGFNNIDRKIQHMVLSHVITALHDHEIFGRIIESIPVNVMHNLMGEKWTAKKLLHYPSVLTRRLTVSRDITVPKAVGRFVDTLASVFETTFA